MTNTIKIANKIYESLINRNEPNSLIQTNKLLTTNSKSSKNDSYLSTEATTLQTTNIIKKKTNKGRKEKIKIENDKPKCEVCLTFVLCSQENVVSCSNCKCLFHKSCYDQYEENNSTTDGIHSYKCIRCTQASKLNIPIHEFKCMICNNSYGVLKFNKFRDFYYHQICLEHIYELYDLKEEDICKENIKKWRYKNSCRYCSHKLSKLVAVTKCKKPKCKEYYHIPCAIQKGLIFDRNFMKQFYEVSNNYQIPFYCSKHNKKISNRYKAFINNFNTYKNQTNNTTEFIKNPFPEIKQQRNIDKNDNEEKEKFKEERKITANKGINEGNFVDYEKEDNKMEEDNIEEKKEDDENSIDITNDHFSDKTNDISILMNFEINDINFNKYNGFFSNLGNCDPSFNTKMHYFPEFGGFRIKRSKSYIFANDD